MATDATGTPTSPLGIPKYNTAADIPSGKGFNAAMDAIDDLIEARAATPAGIASGEAMVWNGTTWARSSVTKIEPTNLKPAGRGIALPGTPYDGQEYVLTDSLDAPTYNWLFRYNAGSLSAYKWEFVGGSAQRSEVTADDGAISSAAFADISGANNALTVARAGEYEVAFGARITLPANVNALIRVAPKIGAAAVAVADCIEVHNPVADGNGSSAARHLPLRTIAAADVVKLQYTNATANAGAIAYRWLRITPIRVS